jgi:hypothetical protein
LRERGLGGEGMTAKKSILLRIDPGLWDDLNSWAADELRSLNGQIEYILREQVRRRNHDRPEKE